MFYALGKGDQALFDEAHNQLEEYFLESDGFVHWKLTEDGRSEVSANALIDDIRIIDALLSARDKWNEEQSTEVAESISEYLITHNVNNKIFTDFYEREDEYASADITLSYIDVQAINKMVDQGLSDIRVAKETIRVLTEAPLDNGFYPKSYNVEEESYSFDYHINMVDQAITAYHHAEAGNPSAAFLEFIKEEMRNRGVVHGMYNRETKEPTVDYESPAVYGFLILYSLEVSEDELAYEIYERMKEFQVTDRRNPYYGGYSIDDDDTHIFDNLVPLLAEQQIRKN